MAIKNFYGDNYYLSNFYPCTIRYNGLTYLNSEAAFQAQKTILPAMRIAFTRMKPDTAKGRGRKVQLRSDWEEVKDRIMYEICLAKFSQHPLLKLQLLNTGDQELVEGNSWNDTYWGVNEKTGEGQNKLGKILMRVRKELGENCE